MASEAKEPATPEGMAEATARYAALYIDDRKMDGGNGVYLDPRMLVAECSAADSLKRLADAATPRRRMVRVRAWRDHKSPSQYDVTFDAATVESITEDDYGRAVVSFAGGSATICNTVAEVEALFGIVPERLELEPGSF